jgi:2-methylisocitrate lyase-like PEP mutase family enzyme
MEKSERFAVLHRDGIFVMPNPWHAGIARILASMGFPAVATSSAALAGTLGRRDGAVSRDEALAHARSIVDAVEVPVSADLENGYEHQPEGVAQTIRLAVGTGLAGCSIEDATGNDGAPIYAFEVAVERIQAAVDAVRATSSGFVLTARAENFLHGRADLDDTIKRLKAFEDAGADVLMAPGLPDLDAVRRVCASLQKPFSFMAGIKGKSFPLAELKAAGVRRVTLSTSLYRTAMTAAIEAATEVADHGTFGFVESAMATADLLRRMGR